jgi:hypothetical protein
VFYAFTQVTIRWVATDNFGVTSVSLYYSTNGGSTYPYTIATGEPNDSTYIWSVPFRNSSNCKVKVVAYDAASNQGNDTSDNNFTITLDMIPPEVTVVKPNGSEVFHEGSQDTIKWIATDNVGVDSVSLYYSTDGGSTYPHTIATGEPNDSTYIWTIPSTLSNTCKVTVVRPNGGELFYVGSQDTIKWVATDNIGVDSVNIYYSIDGGATFPYTVARGEPNDSVYVWTVPDTPSDSCVIRIVAYDPSFNTGQDVSDAFFSIHSQIGTELVPEAARFGMLENYPNPFNPTTRIEFSLGERAQVSMRIYDMSGKVVRTLVNETMSVGRHSASWNGEDEYGRPVASGIYVCRLEAAGKTALRKMVLLR